MTTSIDQAREAVAQFMGRLYARGLTTTSGGNISLRLDEETLLMTPAGLDKAALQPEDIAVMDLDGRNRTPQVKPTSEAAMHVAIYEAHARVKAIVHAHPPAATTFTVSRRPLDCRLVAEAYAIVGDPVIAPYARTGTDALAASVAASFGARTTCVLMENHGVVAVGTTLLEAFDRMEVLEQVARINLFAALLGDTRALNAEQCAALDILMGREEP